MDYRGVYEAFITDRLVKCPDKAKRAGMERHHIMPKCLHGSDDASNIVNLSFSDHIFAHLLLAKIHGGKLAIAFQKMTTVARYQGRHTRLKHAALMAEARKAKGDSRRGEKGKHTPAQAAGLKRFNENRRGQPASIALIEARRRQGDQRRGQKAHPNSVIAASRSGSDRSPAQIERNRKIAENRRGKPPTEKMWAAISKGASALRGKPWPAARRAAHEAAKAIGGPQ